jgi:hypothetical protein
LLIVEGVVLIVEQVLLMVEQETYIGVGFVMFWATFHSSFIRDQKTEVGEMKNGIEKIG